MTDSLGESESQTRMIPLVLYPQSILPMQLLLLRETMNAIL